MPPYYFQHPRTQFASNRFCEFLLHVAAPRRIKQMAGFSVFGTFAHLVMVNYGAPKGTRAAQAAILTFLGAILVTLGTLASVSTWLAVAGDDPAITPLGKTPLSSHCRR
jgi:hypothetical protein